MRHLVTLFDMQASELEPLFQATEELKSQLNNGTRQPLFPGHVLGLLFEKPSLRTRVSFETAIAHLGGNCIYLGQEAGWGNRESVADFARVVSQYVDILVCRAKRHESVTELARYCTCPVINGLTDLAHPCQALADLYTLREEFGSLKGKTLAFVGDGNNVARSLAVACAYAGVRFILAAPEGYRLCDTFLLELKQRVPHACIEMVDSPQRAVTEADAVYTDVWTSMGQEEEREERRQIFADYQVNAKLMAGAPPSAVFLHCLPAHRGEEVTDDVMDGAQSRVIRQAANRMHVQKAVLVWLLQARTKEHN
ncbi:MAG: ornithine carbamoyltransferase [Pirellulaceae bacterium]|nr:ornithine carbamoyltransferase [Planctomycetales bacterium]